MNDETLYLHKLTNQKRRFEKWDIAEEYKKEYMELIDKHIAIEKEKSQKKKDEYQVEIVECASCRKRFYRKDIYIHHRSCYRHSDKQPPKPIVSKNQELLNRYCNSKDD